MSRKIIFMRLFITNLKLPITIFVLCFCAEHRNNVFEFCSGHGAQVNQATHRQAITGVVYVISRLN